MTAPQPSAAGKPFLRVLAGETMRPPPLWLMRQAGRYLPEYRRIRERAVDFLALCYTPELAAEITLQPVRRYGLDAAIVFADILVVADALGQPLTYCEGEGPVLEPIASVDDIERLRRGKRLDRLTPVYETLRRVARELAPEVALIGFAGAPWTVATYMVEGRSSRDFARVKAWAYGDPDGFQTLIDLLVDVTTEYLVEQVRAGAEAVQIFDTWAGVLPETAFERWCIDPVAEIVARLRRACPGLPIIGFPRGAGPLYARYAERVGVDGLSVDTTLPPSWAARELQGRCAVQGNLDPAVLVAGGATLRREAERILAALGEGPFVFNLGHGVLPTTAPEHVAELVAIVRGWRP